MIVLVIIAVAIALSVCFYGGVCLGIADCKKRFNIPKSASGFDEYGVYKFD